MEAYKNITAPMQVAWVNAGIGFNQPTPWTSLGNCAPVFQWIRSYREGVMSLPWTEDWCATLSLRYFVKTGLGSPDLSLMPALHLLMGIVRCRAWATPLGTQQMQQMALDAFRSGMRDRNLPPNTNGVWSGAPPIHSYVMPHTPGNTANSWRRQVSEERNAFRFSLSFPNENTLIYQDTLRTKIRSQPSNRSDRFFTHSSTRTSPTV